MTVDEMIIGVNIGVQKVNSNAFDTYLEEEIEYFLNKAAREYVRRQNIYLKKDLDEVSRPDLVRQEEAFDNLSTVLVTDVISSGDISAASGFDNTKTIVKTNLSSEVFQFAYAQAKVASGSWRACKPISPAEIHFYTKAEYNAPLFRRLPLLLSGTNILVFFDEESSDITEMMFMYIKSLDRMVKDSPGTGEVTTSELPEHTHDEIVDIAVNMILEDIKSQRPAEPEQTTIRDEV